MNEMCIETLPGITNDVIDMISPTHLLTHSSCATIHSTASLNMSIALGNKGFIALLQRDIPASTAALESAVEVRILQPNAYSLIACATKRCIPFSSRNNKYCSEMRMSH
jgi:hypothetical protein